MQLTHGDHPRASKVFHTAGDAFWLIALAVIILFAFFAALGAFSPTEVAGITIAVGLLLVAYLAHTLIEGRKSTDGRDPAMTRARERRGF